MEREGDSITKNIAYGEIEFHPERGALDTNVDLKQNACYDGSTPAMPQPDEGEYAYAFETSRKQGITIN